MSPRALVKDDGHSAPLQIPAMQCLGNVETAVPLRPRAVDVRGSGVLDTGEPLVFTSGWNPHDRTNAGNAVVAPPSRP